MKKREIVFPLLLAAICAWILASSHQSGTWLSGWDTLHPEFNFPLAFERLFFGVFRADQGLGAVAAHSHMSDLPRVALLFLASFIVPKDLLRYLFFSLDLVIGVVGMYFFIKNIIFKLQMPESVKGSSVFAFLGALFYLLNLGTLQQFYVPFEMFSTQYAALPWLLLFATKFLFCPRGKTLLFFALATLFASPMAFASTLWVAFFLAFSLYLLVFIKKHFRQVLILLILTLTLNSFWLLPNAYFIFSGNAAVVPEARTNKIFSQEAFYYNKSYGTLGDALILKNFLFDWRVYRGNDRFDYLLEGWRIHLSDPRVLYLGYFLTGIAIVGAVYGSIKRKPLTLALLLPALMALLFLINQNPPLDGVFTLFREKVPLFSEALRFPFTKFSLIFTFTLSCFFALGQRVIYLGVVRLGGAKQKQVMLLVQLLVFSLLLGLFMKPAFVGDFISSAVQVKIPRDYFNLFNWLNAQEDGRVAIFPVHSLWGWIYYNWGFQGAQFVSFGIKQPLLDRDYDRWSTYNEQYYREISYAVYSQNSDLLKNVLTKYKVRYLLLDKNILAPGADQDKGVLFYNQIDSLISQLEGEITVAKQLGNITIYRVKDSGPVLATSGDYSALNEAGRPLEIDWAYLKGHYFSPLKTNSSRIFNFFNFPFLSISDNQNLIDQSQIKLSGSTLEIKGRALGQPQGIFLQSYSDSETTLPAKLYLKNDPEGIAVKLVLEVVIDKEDELPVINLLLPYNLKKDKNAQWLVGLDNYQTVKVDKIKDEFTYYGTLFLSTTTYNNLAFYSFSERETGKNLNEVLSGAPAYFCSDPGPGQLVESIPLDDIGVEINVKQAKGCLKLPLNKLVESKDIEGYRTLVGLSFQNLSTSGLNGHYCLYDKKLRRCLKEQQYLMPYRAVEDYTMVSEEDLDNLELTLFADGEGKKDKSTLDYYNLKAKIYKPDSFLTVTPRDLKAALQASAVEIGGDKNLSLDLSQSVTDNFDLLDTGRQPVSCGSTPSDKSSRVISPGGFVEYTSEGGSSCDFFSFPNLPHNLGYLLLLEQQNITGLPFRLCVSNNYTKRCDVYTALPNHQTFAPDLVLIPPASDGGMGFDIHFDNYAVSKLTTTNRLRQLKIYPFPYYWLTQMNFLSSGGDSTISSKLMINYYKQIFPGFILTSLTNLGNKPGLVTLPYAFEGGWWMGGGEHVLADGWANAWLIPGGKSGNFVIFYWPQGLEFLGLGIILTVMVTLFRRCH